MRIFVLLPLLIALGMSFSAAQDAKPELRTWTAVNGKEVEAEFVSNEKGIVKLKLKSGKVFEVHANKLSKEDNEFISSLANPEGVNIKELKYRERITYLKGSDTPYTGKVFELYENGKKKREGTFKNGKPDGLVVGWHENGKKGLEGTFKDGKENGPVAEWHENGKKGLEGTFKDGKKDGLWVRWHENGKKKEEVNFKDGEPDGLCKAWHANGQKRSEGTFRDGEEASVKYWNSKGEPVDSAREAN